MVCHVLTLRRECTSSKHLFDCIVLRDVAFRRLDIRRSNSLCLSDDIVINSVVRLKGVMTYHIWTLVPGLLKVKVTKVTVTQQTISK